MSSPIQNSAPTNIIIEIPPEFIENGKTLLIEKLYELFIDGYHLSKPPHSIRQNHGLCLVDTQQQDLRSVTPNHLLESTIDDNQLVQIIIEFPTENLNDGTSVTVEKRDSNGKQEISGNFHDLLNLQHSNKDIHIQIPKQSIERGKTILIQKDNILITNTDDYIHKQSHHLNNNQFAKRDHLQSKKLMEVTIEVPPEILNDGQTITFRKEDAQALAANFPYRRTSKPHLNDT